MTSDTSDTKKKGRKSNDFVAEHGVRHLNTFIEQMFGSELTSLELSELLVSEERFIQLPPAMRQVSDPAVILKTCIPEWQSLMKSPLKNGEPLMLVICSSAMRCCNLNRLLTPFKGAKCKVAKLFSRHMKITSQSSYLTKNMAHLAIGTPARIAQLISSDSLCLRSLRYVVFDWNFRDEKKYRLIDNSDKRRDLSPLLLNILLSKEFQKNASVPDFRFLLL